MSLPIRTSPDDITAVCTYLANKPMGATLAEAKAVLDKKHLDNRKLTALKFWGLIEDDGNRIKVSDPGRRAVKDSSAVQSVVLREILRRVKPYYALIERIAHRSEETIAATEVAAHWHEHFTDKVSQSEKTLTDQAICFFQIAQGADLGLLKLGRRGMPTRFDFDTSAVRKFVDEPTEDKPHASFADEPVVEPAVSEPAIIDHELIVEAEPSLKKINKVFVTHGKNTKILKQVKELLEYGKFEPVVAMEHETAAKPVPKKVMDDMRACAAAVIHVSAEGTLLDSKGEEIPQINGNVLIEIGAAMALYSERFVLLVEEGVCLPSNLQGLYECRYKGDELTMPAIMKLLKAFNEF